ncbi:uncharacterized protein RHOBADRAFT_51121 [Rhodotorula graminis WP1]|uniref:TPR-like protein n=1 Tax=Rhodotorula graminis (strain WP1) TaxID=578459 RepID=A0A194SDX3_RHOGW|nr:uncharacterized protein RHOBADRAFT_51121 [Rhodotorula graminis WP1]KPV78685.1 hypothetical protein RHOBADRAFT_51121 [Rhodotorula graminis WP1]
MAPHIPHPHLHPHSHSSSSSSASPKGARYAATLDSARRLALFTHSSPALAKAAAAAVQGGMDWAELLRKFRKHNPAREVTAAAAHVEHLVHSHLYGHTDSLATSLASGASLTPPPPSLPPLVPTSHRGAILPALDALASATSSAAPGVEADSARAVLAWARYMVGQPGDARQALAGLQSKGQLPAQGEPYDLTLSVLTTAVEGYLAEDAHSPDAALTAYSHASTLYAQALPSSSTDDISLHRVGAHALFRLCVLAPSSTEAHTQYLDRCASAPRLAVGRAFPTAERLWVHRALRHLVSSGAATGKGPGAGEGPGVDGAAMARSHRAEEALIRRGTSLPPAGETNAVYLRFLDEVVAAWRARGLPRSEAGEVIEILYSALSHTFQSHLLLRHLVRALSIAGRHLEATKALRLYRDLWDKARETDAKEVAREMRVLRARAWKEARAAGAGEAGEKEKGVERSGDEDGREEGPYDSDIDSDRAFVDTALFGVRLLCRAQVGEPREAVELARRARAVFDEGRDEELRADKEVEARIETALGVALGALAAKEASPEQRPAQHEEALNHLTSAVTLSPSSFAAHYALAFQLLELRQVSSALEAARSAVERNKRSREAWHLLALCVSAQKDMRGALEVLETALDIEDDGAHDVDERWDRPTDETERLAVEMQLRLTKGAVVEYLEGAPAALADQQDVLAFFSSAYARISDAPRGAAPPSGSVTAGAAANPTSSRPTSALAPAIPLVNGTTTDGASHKLGRTASIVSRRRSVKRQSVAVNGNGSGARPESVNGSLANLSLAESSSPAPASARPATDGNPLATKLLVDTWLASAASFRRARLYDEARGALGEAEQLDADDADVWSQTALLHLVRGEVARAREALTKGLSFDPAHVASRVLLARVYLSAPASGDGAPATPYSAAPPPPPSHLTSAVPPLASPRGGLALSLPLAEALLSTLTAHGGWDVPEAWAELARCYRVCEPRRADKERECLVWALQLEETRPVRPLARAVERAL